VYFFVVLQGKAAGTPWFTNVAIQKTVGHKLELKQTHRPCVSWTAESLSWIFEVNRVTLLQNETVAMKPFFTIVVGTADVSGRKHSNNRSADVSVSIAIIFHSSNRHI
jgi:hypothetical protein